MASNTYDFGAIERLAVNAVGLPGQRTFRLRFLSENGDSASLWIEKEQMEALGTAVDQLMAQLSDDPYVDVVSRTVDEPESAPESFFPEPPAVEFKIGRLALGYDEGKGLFTLLIHDDEEEGATAGFRCLVTHDQLQVLSQQIDAVANAGRPRCPLCGRVLTTGVAHFCPPSNGHAKVQMEEQ